MEYFDIEIRCKKCNNEYLFSKLDNGYCKNCIRVYKHRCHECNTPISDFDYKIRQGYCSECHNNWLKSGLKQSYSEEVYPGTGL